ncbi:hypothetical protein ACFJIX_29500 [Roseateles sp. UC29_93]|uniref:hypothetical protein n=1 Tax=Roseateles sp. UC29_93 TaxID=3350177 RepID=UPI00366AC365
MDMAADQPAKRMRQNAVLPPRTEHLASATTAQASQIGAISSHAAGASQLGGKVIDVPGLPMYSRVPTKGQATEIESTIKDALQGQHGPVQVFGYHVTTQENADAIRNQGFSADANHGLGGGVAGMNIHGSGLYTSIRPVDDYVKPDKTNVMYAVVAPQGAGFKEGTRGTGKSWDAASNAASAHDGDFVNSMSGDRKVNPGAISKVALVPIATIPPRCRRRFSPCRLALRIGRHRRRQCLPNSMTSFPVQSRNIRRPCRPSTTSRIPIRSST